MMSISVEDSKTLAELARLLGPNAAGKPVAPSTIFRWTNQGCHGIRLEYIQIGSSRRSTLAAIQKFSEELTQKRESMRTPAAAPTLPTPAKSSKRRQEKREKTETTQRRLKASGF